MEQEPRPDQGESTTDETNVLSHDVGLEQTDIHTQDAIIDVLAHLHPAPADSSSIGEDIDPHLRLQSTTASQTKDSAETSEPDGLEGWKNKALRQEIVRLRQLLLSYGHTDLTSPHQPTKKRKRSVSITTAPQPDSTVWTITEPRKTKAPLVAKDEETGKRVAKDRRLELSKAVRGKMRATMGISAEDPLPAPSVDEGSNADFAHHSVPNWTDPSDSMNLLWTDRIATELLEEAKNGQHDKVPVEDLTLDIVKAATRTAFLNFSKRYMAENDPSQASKKERFQKNRRRWARKDSKQRKRAKAALDPNLTISVPPIALHLDYMSSECSSPGEDSDPEEMDEETKLARSHRWAQQIAIKAAQAPADRVEGKEWGQAQGEKVLEIRTPRWRSQALSDIYAKLDEIAAENSKARAGPSRKASTLTPKSGHIAPTHSRFTMYGTLARKGRKPKADGESWMWKSGEVGVWPSVEGDGGDDGFYGVSVGDGGDWRAVESDALVQALEGIPSDHHIG